MTGPRREIPFSKADRNKILEWQISQTPKYRCPNGCGILMGFSVNGIYCMACHHIQHWVDEYVLANPSLWRFDQVYNSVTIAASTPGIPMNTGYYSMSGGAIISANLNSFLNHRRGTT